METLCLHLDYCAGDGGRDGERTSGKKEALGRLEDFLWQRLGSEGRSEARMWLCTDIGSLQNIPRQVQASIFLSLVRPNGHTLDELLCRQTLRVACERQPRRVMRIFTRDSKLIRNFFSGHAKRILDWFEKFSSSQRREKETGAQALARFAFVNREKYWNELEWKGTHGQAPATLASKPHYFLDLDVLKTVENFLDYVPEFWSSNELWDSLKDGDLLSLDIDFFVRKLLEKMEDQSSLVWKLLEKFFWEEDFTHLCHRLLSFLEDQKLLQLINELSQGVAHASVTEGRKRGKNDGWFVKVLRIGAECPSLECVMICNACIAHSRQLLRLLQDEENVKDSSSLISSLREMTNSTQQKHRAFWKDCLCWNKWELVKGLALESWAIQVLVLKEAHSTLSLKAFLSANSIQFRQASWDKRKDARVEKMRKRRRKKRRTAHASSDEESNSLESDIATSDRGLGDNNGRWYLSTDNFNIGMEKDEIPEQLANFAFMKWLNWVASH